MNKKELIEASKAFDKPRGTRTPRDIELMFKANKVIKKSLAKIKHG